MWPVYQSIKADPVSPLSRITGGGFGAAYTPPSPLRTAQHGLCRHLFICCRSPPLFGSTSQRPRPRDPKGSHLKEETKMNNFLLHSSLIGVLGAEQSAPKYRRKFPEFRRVQEF